MRSSPNAPPIKKGWFFTDERSKERPIEAEYRIQVRAVSGRKVPTDGLPVVSEVDPASGHQLLSLTGLTELLACVEVWGVPVTLAPPEDPGLPWLLELEDGIHDANASENEG